MSYEPVGSKEWTEWLVMALNRWCEVDQKVDEQLAWVSFLDGEVLVWDSGVGNLQGVWAEGVASRAVIHRLG
jgi:hypothetical protein